MSNHAERAVTLPRTIRELPRLSQRNFSLHLLGVTRRDLQRVSRDSLRQGWGTCGPPKNLIRPVSEFSLPKLEYNIASKRNYMTSRHVVSQSREVSLAP